METAAVREDGSSGRSRLRLSIEIGFSTVAIALVAVWVSNQGLPVFPRTKESRTYLMVAILSYLGLSTTLRGERWHRIIVGTGIKQRRFDSYALVVVGYMGNTILPMRGGEVLRAVLLTRTSNATLGQSVGTIIAERLLDAVSLVLMFLVVAFLNADAAAVGDFWAWLALAGLTVGAVGLIVMLVLRSRGYFETFAAKIRPVTRSVKLLLRPQGLFLLVLSFFLWASDAMVFWLIGKAVSVDITPQDAVALVVLASFFALIPAAPGYLGTYDAALAIGLKGAGITSGPAVAFALLVRFVIYVPITVIGLALLVARYGGLSELRPSRIRADRAEVRRAEAEISE